MTTVEEFIVKYLTETDAVTAIIGTRPARIYPDAAPQARNQQAANFPRVTFQLIDAPQKYNLSGPAGMAVARLQVDLWASGSRGYSQVKALEAAIRTADGGGLTKENGDPQTLDGYAGDDLGLHVYKCMLDDRHSMPEPPAHGEEQPTRRISLDFVITYRE